MHLPTRLGGGHTEGKDDTPTLWGSLHLEVSGQLPFKVPGICRQAGTPSCPEPSLARVNAPPAWQAPPNIHFLRDG